MRTLTLGVLIASGGTLAALPFRRYHAIREASSAPTQVTGPTHSALDTPDTPSGQVNTLAASESFIGPALDSQHLKTNLPQWTERAAPRPPHRMDVPLSYEDLALPIDQPPAIDLRFNATARAHKKKLDRERAAELVMPLMESLAVSQQEELQRAVTTVPQLPSSQGASNPHATGTLASVTRRDAKIEPLPEASPVAHDRHWIRQPD